MKDFPYGKASNCRDIYDRNYLLTTWLSSCTSITV